MKNPEPRLSRATTGMAIGTTLSRITGVGRMIALAYALGFTSVADAYNLANTIPNIVHDVVLGGVLSATFVPVFVDRMATRADDEAWDAISAVTTMAFVVLSVACAVFLLAAPFIVDATTAFNQSRHAALERPVATDLLWLFVPQLACYGFVSITTALLNARRRFNAPMFAPIANNLLLIAILVGFGLSLHHPDLLEIHDHQVYLLVLGLGTTLGVAVQALVLMPSLRRAGIHLHWNLSLRHEAVRTVMRLSGWTLGFVLANQIALLAVLTLSEHVGTGAVTAYTYAYTFFQLPFGIVAISIMSATTPALATHWTLGDLGAFRRRFATGLRAMLAIVVPAAAGELVLARLLVALLLGHGAGSVATSVPTGQALAMLALGLPGFCVFLYVTRAFQAMQDTRSAFWLYAVENGVNIVLAVALAGPLGVRGIALSISLAYSIAAVVAFWHLDKRVRGLDGAAVLRPLGRVGVSTIALAVAAALGSSITGSDSGLGLLVRVTVGLTAGFAGYVTTAMIATAISSRAQPGA